MIRGLSPASGLPQIRIWYYASAQQALQQRLDAFCREVLANQTERLIADIQIVEGSPVRVILEEARRAKAELIVLGSHGHPAIGEAALDRWRTKSP